MSRATGMFELIERALEGGIAAGPPMEQAAFQFAEFSREIRARVASALELSRSGLRMELLAAMQEQPPLIDTADRLTSELAIKWREKCKQYGLEVPAKISSSALEELQLAVATTEDSGIAPLHRLYRRQNLGLASMFDRLQTLRRIARVDKSNAIWADDLPVHEAEALRELRGRFADAIRGEQLEDAAEILEALGENAWISPEASKLAERSQGEFVRATAEQARKRSVECAREMYSAYMAESLERVGSLLSEWDALVEQMHAGGLEPSRGASLTVDPIRQWRAQREEHAEVVRETHARIEGLERAAVDTKASADEIQARLVAAEQMPGGVPDELREMARRRVREHGAAIRTRRAVKFLAVGAGIVAVLATAIWLVVGALREERERAFAESVAAAVEREDGAEVDRLITQAHDAGEGMEKLPAVLELLDRHKRKLNEHAERDRQFDEQMTAAGTPSGEGEENSAFKAALELARTDAHRARIQAWRDAQQAAAVRSQQARDAEFVAQVTALAREIDAVAALRGTDSSADAEVRRVELLAAHLGSAEGIGQDARAAFDTQRRRLLAKRDELNEHAADARATKAHASAVDEVIAAASDPSKLAAALTAFADANPDSPYADDFRDAAASASEWQPLLAWMPVASRLAREGVPTSNAGRAELRDELGKFASAHPKSVISQPLSLFIDLLADGKNWADWLNNIIKTWPPMSMTMVELVSGMRYYAVAGTMPTPTGTQGVEVINVVLSWSDEKVGPVRIERSQVKSLGPSPQQKLADDLASITRGAGARHTGEAALEAIAMIRDRATVDPVARAYLLNGLLPQVLPSLPSLSAKVTRSIDLLKDEDLEAIDWLAPGVPSARKDFKPVTSLLTLAVPVSEWQSALRAQSQSVTAWLRSSLRVAGILDRTGGSLTVRARHGSEPRAGEHLYAVVSREGTLRVEEIGTVAADGESRMQPAAADLPSGTPIFAGSYAQPVGGGGTR